MELLLSGEAEKIITRKLESGSYNSVEEVVMTALKLLEDQDHDDLSRLRVEIEAGIEEAERGRSRGRRGSFPRASRAAHRESLDS